MLNKITEDTFASLSTQILFFIETCNASLFKGVIKLIYDKAVSEPKVLGFSNAISFGLTSVQFSRMYAQLCLMISEKCPEKTQTTGEVRHSTPFQAYPAIGFEVSADPVELLPRTLREESLSRRDHQGTAADDRACRT